MRWRHLDKCGSRLALTLTGSSSRLFIGSKALSEHCYSLEFCCTAFLALSVAHVQQFRLAHTYEMRFVIACTLLAAVAGTFI